MNAFFSDLDNTLIYSHRKHIQSRKVLVESLDGKEQSFMTDYAFSFFRIADWLCLVPVTTRSEAQYRRLIFPDSFRIRYALICNGGKLLVDGVEDQKWSEETLALVQEDLPELEELGRQLGELCEHEVRKPECYYYYAKSDEAEKVCDMLRSKNRDGNIRIEHDHRKVYLFPKSVNKGLSVRRFFGRFQVGYSVGAGDSLMDVPLLNAVDYAFAPESVCELVTNPKVSWVKGEIVSDQICNGLESLHLKGIL